MFKYFTEIKDRYYGKSIIFILKNNLFFTLFQKLKNKKRIEILFIKVMSDLNLLDWKLRWMDGDAFCWRHSKQIDICPMYSYSSCAQMLLHEIAHINNDGNGHREIFFIDMIKLIKNT